VFAWPSWAALDAERIGVWVAAILTLAVLSAAFAENRFSRAAFALLTGLVVGYAAALVGRAVLWPRILLVWNDPAGQWPLLVWFVLGLLLLARGLTAASWLGNLSLAYLVGVGVALAIGGAVLGTAVPQLMALAAGPGATTGSWPAIANVLLVALGTGGVLFRFTYTGLDGDSLATRLWGGVARSWGRAGYAFILVAFGVLFASAIISLLALLAARLQFLLVDWLRIAVVTWSPLS
jgi:hypothetical protein